MARRGGSRRTYVRDANGRFASTPGGSARKAAQSQSGKKGTLASRSSLKRSRSKLAAKDKADQSLQGTLSRRAQKGAVTRGNKALKAAKAESRTRLKVGKPDGVIGKKKDYGKPPAKAKSDTSTFRPGEFYRGNFRPRNVTGKPQKNEDIYDRLIGGPKHAASNLQKAEAYLKARGFNVYRFSEPGNKRIAEAALGQKNIGLNSSAPYWAMPRVATADLRRSKWWSSSSPMAVLHHEIGHTKDKASQSRFLKVSNDPLKSNVQKKTYMDWKSVVKGEGGPASKMKRAWRMRDLAGRVSEYARQNPVEFIAETYAGRRTGRKYDYQVMDAYREARGLPPLRLKGQKPIRRKPKP